MYIYNLPKKVNYWVEKWHKNKSISKNRKKFIMVNDSTTGEMYSYFKIQKLDNLTRVITIGCNSAIENLSIFVENVLYDIASKLRLKIKGTSHMFEIIDNFNSLDLPLNFILVSFDICFQILIIIYGFLLLKNI